MKLRLIQHGASAAAVNMAVDEALLELVGAGQSQPTLRLYQWDPPAISLGYFQKYAEFEELAAPAGALAVVRRLTGGGAILHDRELTYSLTVPIDHPLTAGGPNRLYERAHDAVIAALAEVGRDAHRGCTSDGSNATRGPFFCFARRHCFDVLIGADKIAGSAQRRTRTGILQHGSIILQRRYDQQPAAAAGEVDITAFSQRFAGAFAAAISATLQDGELTTAERQRADALVPKYAGEDWTRMR